MAEWDLTPGQYLEVCAFHLDRRLLQEGGARLYADFRSWLLSVGGFDIVQSGNVTVMLYIILRLGMMAQDCARRINDGSLN